MSKRSENRLADLQDLEPSLDEFRTSVVDGLSSPQKTLPANSSTMKEGRRYSTIFATCRNITPRARNAAFWSAMRATSPHLPVRRRGSSNSDRAQARKSGCCFAHSTGPQLIFRSKSPANT